MNLEEIDKWLDNEYGVSYTRLDELLSYYFERYTDKKEEVERLNNIINELEKWLEERIDEYKEMGLYDNADMYEYTLYTLQELKGSEIDEK